MFQIQYFNVVLWTSIGLTVILFFTVYLMLNMPLMVRITAAMASLVSCCRTSSLSFTIVSLLQPDTLLFGESAKLVGDD